MHIKVLASLGVGYYVYFRSYLGVHNFPDKGKLGKGTACMVTAAISRDLLHENLKTGKYEGYEGRHYVKGIKEDFPRR